MTNTYYTTYWINKRNDVRKEHATHATEEEAKEAILAWWEINNESYDYEIYRTNTDALEIKYIDEFSFYRIEQTETDKKLPSKSYKLKSSDENLAKRKQLNLDDNQYTFDELAEPYRDRLIKAMGDPVEARKHIFDSEGKVIRTIEQ